LLDSGRNADDFGCSRGYTSTISMERVLQREGLSESPSTLYCLFFFQKFSQNLFSC